MALQVWLNTQNNIENHGVGTMDITSSQTPKYINGKLGTSLVTGTNYIKIPWDCTSNELTIALWVKPISPTSWSDIFSIGEGDNRLEISTSTTYYWYCSNSKPLVKSGTVIATFDNEKWYHLAMTVDGSKVKFFIDGVLSKETEQLNSIVDVLGENKNITIASRIGGDNKYAANLSDIRIYNNCLSIKEIKEVSKGLICHYPLNDVYATSSINKYYGEYFNGRARNYNDDNQATVTKLSDDRGYNYKYSYTGTGTNTWKTFYFPNFVFVAGKNYDYSCKVRCNSCTSNVVLTFRASRMGNDWETPKSVNIVSSSIADGQWREYHLIITLQETSVRAGTTYTTNPLIEFYTTAMATKDAVFSFDFDVKDVQVSESTVSAPISDHNLYDNIIYDTSGNNFSGTILNNAFPAIYNDSPRYDYCYSFTGENYLTVKNPLHSDSTDFSIACWVKFLNNNTQTIYTARTQVGNGIAVFFIGNRIRLDDNILTTFDYDMTKYIKNWCHICVTRNKSCKKLYINGQLVSTVNQVGDLQKIGKNGTIGAAGKIDDGIGTGNFLYGYMSDFRIYGTALSDNDIKNMYESPVSLTNTGVLMTQGELKEN